MNGIEELYNKDYLQGYCTNLAGRYNNVLIFNLKNKKRNFDIKQKAIDKVYTCNAETLSRDHKSFVSDNDTSFFFQNGETQSNKFAHSGKFSCRLNSQSPYGMTVSLTNLKIGESFTISVWRKTNTSSKGGLVASSNAQNPYYNSDYKILTSSTDGWEKIGFDIFVSAELAGQELGVYVYNPDPEPVYFDDLEIVRYKSVVETL